MKECKWIAVILLILLFLTGCTPSIQWDEADDGKGNGLVEYKDDAIPFKFEYTTAYDNLRNGRLIFTIDKSWVVTNVADIPEEGGIRTDRNYIMIYDDFRGPGEKQIAYWYPEDVVLEDGSFVKGTYFVMIQMTVTSEDAENWTNEDIGPNGGAKSWWPDPYIFEIPCSLKYPKRTSYSTQIAYFSDLWSVEAGNGYQFYLEPGQTKTLVFGYLIQDDWDTYEPCELSKLRLRIALNGAYTEVFLPLGESELPE